MTTATATDFLPVVATGAAATGSMVVSVHDLAPSNRAVVEPMLEKLSRLGVRVCSLLVVPNYHHLEPLEENAGFLAWLRDLEARGHEVVIHGYFHKRPARAGETIIERLITRFYTQGEGEFFDLTYDEAYRRITAARDTFAGGGLKPRGFIAPAWLLSSEGEAAARDAGMEYTTRLRTVSDLRSGQKFAARSLVYSVRSNWRREVSLLWNKALLDWSKDNTLLRLSIHPPDASFPAIWRQVERFIVRMAETRTAMTYADWIAEQRIKADSN